MDFEGIDGSGKTSLSNCVMGYLRDQGYTVHHVREKGVFRSEVSKRIRTVTRDPHLLRMGDITELLMYVARDAQMVEEFIKPRLKDNAIIFCDRYFYSSVSHSHFARGVDRETVNDVIRAAAQGIWPDLVVYCDVNTLTSRIRKRVQKIHDHRFGDFGRKGLMGLGFREGMRDGFLKMAEENPDSWTVINNVKNTFEQSIHEIYAAVADAMEKKGFPRPKPLELEVKTPHIVDFGRYTQPAEQEKIVSGFYDTLKDYAAKQPGLAGFYLVKMDTPEAYALRDIVSEKEPEVVAFGLRGMKSPESMAYRRKLIDVAPFFIARSLTGMKTSEEAMALRKELAGREPQQVALSLRGIDTPDAWGLRRRLRDDAFREVLVSLRGLDTEDAWKVRKTYFKKKFYEPIAESLAGLDTDQAWELREAMLQKALPWVLRSLKGCKSERADAMRFKYIHRAPKIIVKTIGRRTDDNAWAIREKTKRFAKETLDSISALDLEKAWNLRFELCEVWPNTAVSSLGAGNQSERAWRFRWETLEKHPDNLLLVKHIVKAVLRSEEDDFDED